MTTDTDAPSAAGKGMDHIAPALRALAVPIESLNLDPKNARKHDERNLGAIRRSLERFGQRLPIVVQREGMIVRAGNGRLMMARAIGWTHVAAVVCDDANDVAAAFAIADNRTAELAEWDDGALGRILADLPAELRTLVGFDQGELDELAAALTAHDGLVEEDDEPEPPSNPITKKGDLWLMGGHRLLCGDSTKEADVSRLMAGHKAALCSTDPPYLVDYTGDRPNDSGKDWSATYKEVEITDADGFFRGVFSNVLRVVAPHAAIYCWHAHRRCGDIQRIWAELGILDHQQVIWVKPTPVFGRVYWHFRHEPCMMGWIKGSQPEHDSNHEHNSVWEVDWEGKSRIIGNEHPTQKPVEIFARPIRKHTKPGDICFEPFSGSGSQLIAAEKHGRRCFAMELEPVFVDVAVARWEKFTGRKAQRVPIGGTEPEQSNGQSATEQPAELPTEPTSTSSTTPPTTPETAPA